MATRRKKSILIRQALFVLGCLLIVIAPLVGAIPGPGGVFVFAAGLALVLQNSEWAKRQYVKFKRSHPNKGRWADWGMRRQSALRREALVKERLAAGQAADLGPDPRESDAPASGLGRDSPGPASEEAAGDDTELERARR